MKRGKSDALDAEAICEAVQHPTMRFVPTKTIEQQTILMTHRARSLLVRQRTMLANALRSYLAELGFVANPGIANLAKLAEQVLADRDSLPSYAQSALEILIRQITGINGEIRLPILPPADQSATGLCRLARCESAMATVN